jgi:hypothetical protein
LRYGTVWELLNFVTSPPCNRWTLSSSFSLYLLGARCWHHTETPKCASSSRVGPAGD